MIPEFQCIWIKKVGGLQSSYKAEGTILIKLGSYLGNRLPRVLSSCTPSPKCVTSYPALLFTNPPLLSALLFTKLTPQPPLGIIVVRDPLRDSGPLCGEGLTSLYTPPGGQTFLRPGAR